MCMSPGPEIMKMASDQETIKNNIKLKDACREYAFGYI